MTPGARVAAAIEICDEILAGGAPEQVLTRWARAHRFAGSKDRAAIRDHVFDALRIWRLAAHLGNGTDGRARMIGVLRHQKIDLSNLFNGEGHAPDPLAEDELRQAAEAPDLATRLNLPDWLVPVFEQSLGDSAEETAMMLQARAPVTVRVNTAQATVAQARQALDDAGIKTQPNPRADTALVVVENARKLRNSDAYLSGKVELQDASSQAAIAVLPQGKRVLDFCAGGGGKALAVAAQNGRDVFAHDLNASRLRDLPLRAKRAKVDIPILDQDALERAAAFDLVICDVPCSGSGTWRRSAGAKWQLTADELVALNGVQSDILQKAQALVAPGGTLVYMTCSIFKSENQMRIAAFLAEHANWQQTFEKIWDVSPEGDGFFTAHLARAE